MPAVTGGAAHLSFQTSHSLQRGKHQSEGGASIAAAPRAQALGLHSAAQDAVLGEPHSATGGAVMQRAQLLQEESLVLKDAVVGTGHASPAAAAAAASAPLVEDVVMEAAAPVHASLHAGHAGVDHVQQQQRRNRVGSPHPVTQRLDLGFGRQEQQQQPLRSLPQPSVAKHAPPAAGFGCRVGSSPPGACIQLSSVLMQLADPAYSSEAAKQDFMAWQAALGNG